MPRQNLFTEKYPAEPGQLTSRWTPLIPHPEQLRLINSPARFKVVPAGRRSGKTERAKRNLIIQALKESAEGTWHDYRYFAAAPTRDQAKAIWWSDLKAMVPAYLRGGPIRESDLTIRLITGAEIVVVGLDRPQRIEGRAWNGGVVDEVANIRPGAWGENIRPALSDRTGWCWLIGVPEGRGEYYDMYTNAVSGTDPEWDGFTWVSADILPAAEIASARRNLDELVFQQEYEASFITFEGRAYHAFSVKDHCRPLAYDPRAPIAFCFDFNVEPGVACVVQEQRLPHGIDGTGVIGEVHIPRNSTTPSVCRKLVADWSNHHGTVALFGDASGGARGSARIQGSDWDLVKAELRPVFGDRLTFQVPPANPPERARLNAVNSRLRSAAGEVRLMIDPQRAPHVVRDLAGVRLLAGGAGEIDKRADPKLTHMCFAAGTLVDLDTGPCRIEDVPETGGVRTWDGSFVEYSNAGKTIEDAEIVSVQMSNGSIVYCTPWHQWLTDMGWQCAESLEGLELKSWQSRLSQIPSRFSTEMYSAYTQDTSTSQEGHGTRRMELSDTFTEPSGSTITAPFRRAITSTMENMAGRTIRSITWSALRRLSTSLFTKLKTRKAGNWLDSVALSLLGLSLLSGTPVKTAMLGIGSITRTPRTSSTRRFRAYAPTAARPSKDSPEQCSAARTARPVRDITAASTMKIVPAKAAALPSGQIAMREPSTAPEPAHQPLLVERVRREAPADVYCIKVPSTGCFALSNGAIVSNSDALGYYIAKRWPIVRQVGGVGRWEI